MILEEEEAAAAAKAYRDGLKQQHKTPE